MEKKHKIGFDEANVIFKETFKQREADANNMLPEYDFKKMTGGVQGKYYKAYREGHTVTTHKSDGTTIVQDFKLESVQ
jgi:hypothetical protein